MKPGLVLACLGLVVAAPLAAEPPRLRAVCNEGHTGRVDSVAFSPDGTALATGDYLGGLRIWELRPPTPDRR